MFDRDEYGVSRLRRNRTIDRFAIDEVRRKHEVVAAGGRMFGTFGKVVEHQHALTQAIGADLEARAVRRERVGTEMPRLFFPDGHGCFGVMLAVVEHQLGQPVRPRRRGRRGEQVGEVRNVVAVGNALYVSIGRTRKKRAIALVKGRRRDACGVLPLVAIDHDVALVVMDLADEPRENACLIVWIEDPTLGSLTVPARDVVFGDRAPEHIGRVADIGPELYARE